jgi:hypothetical protein
MTRLSKQLTFAHARCLLLFQEEGPREDIGLRAVKARQDRQEMRLGGMVCARSVRRKVLGVTPRFGKVLGVTPRFGKVLGVTQRFGGAAHKTVLWQPCWMGWLFSLFKPVAGE